MTKMAGIPQKPFANHLNYSKTAFIRARGRGDIETMKRPHMLKTRETHPFHVREQEDAQFLTQISFLLQLFSFSLPQAATYSICSQTSSKVCHKAAWTDLPYLSSDNLRCGELCKSRLRSASTSLEL